MKRMSDWEETRAAMGGDSERLSLGGHVCKIIGTRIDTTTTGKEQLVLCFDVDEGTEYDGIFKRQYDGSKGRGNDKWPNGGTFRQFTRDFTDPGKTNPYFKGLIQAVVESNSGYQWDWNERSLVGRYIGFVFGEEEYMGQDGEIKRAVKARYCCPSDSAPDKEAPALKPYKGPKPQTTQSAPGGFTETTDDELPF